MGQHSALVNESVGPSGKTAYSDLTLQLFGGEQNFTYSKLVNASENLFPYLSSVATQSFDYNGSRYSVHVNVTASGTTTVAFKGSDYTLDVLTVSVSASYESKSVGINGTIEMFPSTLVYSASVGNSTDRLQVVLQETDLPLISTSPKTTTAAYVGAGVGIGALVLGGTFLLTRRGKKVGQQKEKPLHWVD
jgi:hypothetical protein